MNLDKAHECASLSLAIYNNNVEDLERHIQKVFPGNPFQVYFIQGVECACVSFADKKETWVVFRGTDFHTHNDVLANLDVNRVEDSILPKVWVHRGFMYECNKVWNHVLYFIQSHAARKYHKLVFCGHSLGGAVALLMGTRMARTFDLCNIECYTFGAPCVGGQSWENWFNSQINLVHYRFDHNNDVVPKLKSLRLLGYRHVGQRMYITHLKNLITHNLTWKERLNDWLWGHLQALVRLQLFDSLKDHKLEKYIEFFKFISSKS